MTSKQEAWLDAIRAKLLAMGHATHAWRKTRWGFHTTCVNCGAFTAVTLSKALVREFPQGKCMEAK